MNEFTKHLGTAVAQFIILSGAFVAAIRLARRTN
jgi:hypothetical protein